MTLRGRLDPGEGRILLVRILGATCVEAVRPTASYRAIELGANPFEVGIVAGSFAALAFLVAVPVGRVVDRRGERAMLVSGVALLACAGVIGAGLPYLTALIVMQALLGCGQVCLSVSCQTLSANAARRAPDHRFARLSVAVAGGHMLGPLIAGIVIDRSLPGFTALSGTVGSFTTVVVIGAAAVLVGSSVRSTPPKQRQAATNASGASPITELLRIRGLPSAVYAGIAVITTVDLTVAYLPVVGESRGIPASVVGYLLATRAAMSIVSRLSMGWLLDSLGRRRLLELALGASALAIVGVAFPLPVAVLFVLLAVAGFLLGIGIPMTTAWVAIRAPEGSRGVALGLRTSGNRASQLLVPIAVGGAAAGLGAPVVFVVSAVALAFGSRLVRRAPIEA